MPSPIKAENTPQAGKTESRSLSPKTWTAIAASLVLGTIVVLLTLSRTSNAVHSEKPSVSKPVKKEKPAISKKTATTPPRRESVLAIQPLLPVNPIVPSPPSTVAAAAPESPVLPPAQELKKKDEATVGETALLEKAEKTADASEKEALLRQALAKNPDNDEAMALLSLTLMIRPKTRPEAMALARKAAEINVGNATAWLAMGYIHRINGKFDKAKEAYQKCAASSGPVKTVTDCRKFI